MKILITGSSGFIGKALSTFLKEQGHDLLLLSRSPHPGMQVWNPEANLLDPSLVEGVDVVINLAGETILGRWSEKKMERIRESRLRATQLLCQTLAAASQAPALFLNASAIGYYGDRGTECVTEESPPGAGYLAEVCQQWEGAAQSISALGTRLLFMRFGLVLGREGGVLSFMKAPFKMGLGGYLGKGTQIMSWIALDDLVRAVAHLISHTELQGPINFVSPEALSNREFMQRFAQTMHHNTLLPVPSTLLSLFFGAGSELFLSSIHAYPKRLLDSGFQFLYPSAESAFAAYT